MQHRSHPRNNPAPPPKSEPLMYAAAIFIVVMREDSNTQFHIKEFGCLVAVGARMPKLSGALGPLGRYSKCNLFDERG